MDQLGKVANPAARGQLNREKSYWYFPVNIYTAIRYHRVSPEMIGSRNCVPMAFTGESPPAQGQYPQGSFSKERCFSLQVTMDKLAPHHLLLVLLV